MYVYCGISYVTNSRVVVKRTRRISLKNFMYLHFLWFDIVYHVITIPQERYKDAHLSYVVLRRDNDTIKTKIIKIMFKFTKY